jgi:uncharacterized membrane protein YqiK
MILHHFTSRRLSLALAFAFFAAAPAQAQSADDLLGSGLSIALPILLVITVLLLLLWFFISRYRRCPSDKILVIYGKTGQGSANCIHGGAAFVWPVIQDYQYLDL